MDRWCAKLSLLLWLSAGFSASCFANQQGSAKLNCQYRSGYEYQVGNESYSVVVPDAVPDGTIYKITFKADRGPFSTTTHGSTTATVTEDGLTVEVVHNDLTVEVEDVASTVGSPPTSLPLKAKAKYFVNFFDVLGSKSYLAGRFPSFNVESNSTTADPMLDIINIIDEKGGKMTLPDSNKLAYIALGYATSMIVGEDSYFINHFVAGLFYAQDAGGHYVTTDNQEEPAQYVLIGLCTNKYYQP